MALIQHVEGCEADGKLESWLNWAAERRRYGIHLPRETALETYETMVESLLMLLDPEVIGGGITPMIFNSEGADFVITASGDIKRVQQSGSSGYAALQGSLAILIPDSKQALIMPTWESNWLERQLHVRDMLLKHATGRRQRMP